MTYETDNIFARILKGEIPCHKVYEDDTALVMMDIFPQSKGHCLVIPKAASRNLLDAEPATLADLFSLVQRVARAAKAALNANGIRIAQFNETEAGQTVFHLHVHVIPAYAGADIGRHGQSGKADDAELADLASRIGEHLT